MNIWSFIHNKLTSGQRSVLMVVIDHSGSSPGRKGFKMAVAEDGELHGSIGGGVMEYRLTEQARKLFQHPEKPYIKHQDHHAENSKDSSGLACSGSQVVAFYLLDKSFSPTADNLAKARSGRLTYDHTGIQFDEKKQGEGRTEIRGDNQWVFIEHHGYRHFLYLFGAGHVSVAVSRLFRQLGFYITVFDNRSKEPATFKNNRFAHEKQIIDYKDAANYIPEGDHVYVAIMTFAHKNDSFLLKQLIDKNMKYLGMMGSDNKVASVFRKLEQEGVLRNKLNKVDAPIGLPIHSQTPEEIAVSIAAKIVQVKNG